MKKTVSQLKKKVWAACSEYVRRRDADWRGYVVCVTCGKVMPWKEAQAGHFVPGRRNSVLFDTRHIYPQCPRCNVFLHGNLIAYYPFMLKKVGKKVIEELKRLSQKDKQFTRAELEQLLLDFKQKLLDLDEQVLSNRKDLL